MLDIDNVGNIYRNLDVDILIDRAIKNNNAKLSFSGALMIDTGKFTGRSPKDKYFVDSDKSNKNIAWGDVNKSVSKDVYKYLLEISKKQLSNKDLYVSDVYCGANINSRKSIRFICEFAWQAHFVHNMFILPSKKELENFKPDITVYNACKATNPNYKEQNLNSENYVVFNIEKNEIIIGGTWYTGEMKKGIFTMMNYYLPLTSKLTMHCSANVGKNGDSALFFGLSGTGKTTLSTDSKRALVGDDEHGWDDDGIFNLEGGCYAKLISLSKDNEPDIFNAIKKGAMVENVVANEKGIIDYSDDSKTENTRVSYPINHIKNIQKNSIASHPKNIIFLSADAFGVLPPVSKLDKEQVMYYFLSGYTAKIAGTEIGIKEPIATFSACFGEAFLPLKPSHYAKLLKEKIEKHNVNVYLVNTGWSGGAYRTGSRISIKNTRACIDGILNGDIEKSEFEIIKILNLAIPKTINGVNANILNPRNTWEDKEGYDKASHKLVDMYKKNFERFS